MDSCPDVMTMNAMVAEEQIIANHLETMESSQITATIYCRDGRTIKPPKSMYKADFAVWLIKSLEEITPSI